MLTLRRTLRGSDERLQMKAFKGLSRSAGLAPGTVQHEHHQDAFPTSIRMWTYDSSTLEEISPRTLEQTLSGITGGRVNWIRVIGLRDTVLIKGLCEHLGLHPLLIEDIFNAHQRPKQEQSGEQIFITLNTITSLSRGDGASCGALHTSLFVKPEVVVTFEEAEVGLLEGITRRLADPQRRIRRRNSDYLMQAILDMLVDGYFLALEDASDQIEELESQLTGHPSSSLLSSIQTLRTEMLLFRKSVWPLREVIGGISRVESGLISADTVLYLRDVYEHTVQVIDTTETLREILSGMVDTYLSGISNQMNKVMQVLTIVSTIFIPITFLAGLYGMNFKYMPELGAKWGYPAILALMAITSVGMLLYFRRKKWM
jgi:magnesium transporter